MENLNATYIIQSNLHQHSKSPLLLTFESSKISKRAGAVEPSPLRHQKSDSGDPLPQFRDGDNLHSSAGIEFELISSKNAHGNLQMNLSR